MSEDGAADADWKSLRKRRSLINDLDVEVDRQLMSAEGRSRDAHTRASILVAAASILVGLSSLDAQLDAWFIAAIIAAALAAIAGVVVLLPRYGDELDIEAQAHQLWDSGDTTAKWELLHAKIGVLKDLERALVWRAWVISAGFTALLFCLIAAALSVIT